MTRFEAAIKIKKTKKGDLHSAYTKYFIKDELMQGLGDGFIEKPMRKETLLKGNKKIS